MQDFDQGNADAQSRTYAWGQLANEFDFAALVETAEFFYMLQACM